MKKVCLVGWWWWWWEGWGRLCMCAGRRWAVVAGRLKAGRSRRKVRCVCVSSNK